MSLRTVLLIAFHFPPLRGISGIQRTLCFARHLPTYGWKPIVLTVTPSAYRRVAPVDTDLQDLPFDILRARAFDAAVHFSLFGRYPRWLALPDRWMSWRPFAVRTALAALRRQPIDAIWSTFPIATAHQVGMNISHRTGIPWIAEFRDPMWQGSYPPDPTVNRNWQELEQQVFRHASRVVVTTPGAASQYADRFPTFDRHSLHIIENGYDEDAFSIAEASLSRRGSLDTGMRDRLTLIHSGFIYPSERDPSQLFEALAALKRQEHPAAKRLRIVLRATGDDERYLAMVDDLGLQDTVVIKASIAYVDALQEMMTADGLLLLQASNCNAQIPAKLYEYLRSGKPIVALTDPSGDTAATLRSIGTGLVARLDAPDEIRRALTNFVAQADSGTYQPPPADVIQRYSRAHQAALLAKVLTDAIETRG